MQTVTGEETIVEHQFSVDDTQPSFHFYQRYVLMSDHATVVCCCEFRIFSTCTEQEGYAVELISISVSYNKLGKAVYGFRRNSLYRQE